MEKASARVANRITNDVVCGTSSATAASATTTIRIFDAITRHAHSRPNNPVGFTARIKAIGA